MDGSARFLRRLWNFAYELGASGAGQITPGSLSAELAAARREIHAVLKQANYDMTRHQFNTVASAAMKILNALETAQKSGADGGDAGRSCTKA